MLNGQETAEVNSVPSTPAGLRTSSGSNEEQSANIQCRCAPECACKLLSFKCVSCTDTGTDYCGCETCSAYERLELVQGFFENMYYCDHRRGKNWAAKVVRDIRSIGGIKREFLPTAEGNRSYHDASSLREGDYLEIAGDYISSRGNRSYDRHYFRLVKFVFDEQGVPAFLLLKEVRLSEIPRIQPIRGSSEYKIRKAVEKGDNSAALVQGVIQCMQPNEGVNS